jgi:dUTPase
MRVAQLVIAPVARAELVVVPTLSGATGRGAGGFGSTGA